MSIRKRTVDGTEWTVSGNGRSILYQLQKPDDSGISRVVIAVSRPRHPAHYWWECRHYDLAAHQLYAHAIHDIDPTSHTIRSMRKLRSVDDRLRFAMKAHELVLATRETPIFARIEGRDQRYHVMFDGHAACHARRTLVGENRTAFLIPPGKRCAWDGCRKRWPIYLEPLWAI